jgi:hypothetical protein
MDPVDRLQYDRTIQCLYTTHLVLSDIADKCPPDLQPLVSGEMAHLEQAIERVRDTYAERVTANGPLLNASEPSSFRRGNSR